jgi:hypothetical protein
MRSLEHALDGCHCTAAPHLYICTFAAPDYVARFWGAARDYPNDATKSEDRAQSALDTYEKVNDQMIKFSNDAAHQTYNVAIAKADGDRKVALATCESQRLWADNESE